MKPQHAGLACTGQFEFKGRAPSKKYACPTCQVVFVAVNKNGGKTCPAGHWTSLHYLNYYAAHGRLPEPRAKKPKPPKAEKLPPGTRTVLREVGIPRHGDQCAVALQWWVAAYERLLEQLPVSTSKVLVSGALGQAYTLSKQLVR